MWHSCTRVGLWINSWHRSVTRGDWHGTRPAGRSTWRRGSREIGKVSSLNNYTAGGVVFFASHNRGIKSENCDRWKSGKRLRRSFCFSPATERMPWCCGGEKRVQNSNLPRVNFALKNVIFIQFWIEFLKLRPIFGSLVWNLHVNWWNKDHGYTWWWDHDIAGLLEWWKILQWFET